MQEYNTAIKDIAGVHEVNTFYKIFSDYRTAESLNDDQLMVSLGDIRTEKTRKKVAWAIRKSLLNFSFPDHEELVSRLFMNEIPSDDKRFYFFWHFNITNRLFREISTQVFGKTYFSGRAAISQDDIIPFLKEIVDDENKQIWSDNTIYRLATKYLSLTTKLNFVTEGRVKSFKHIRPSSEAQVLFLYFAKLLTPSASDILTNELLPVSFVPSEDVQDRLKKLSLKGFFNMNFNGVALNIELTHSYKGICDALYN